MKTSVRNLRKLIQEAVREVLTEAKCPSCGTPGAYHGFTSVECPNNKCVHFSPKQVSSKPSEVLRALVRRVNTTTPDLFEQLMILPKLSALDYDNHGEPMLFPTRYAEVYKPKLSLIIKNREDATNVVKSDDLGWIFATDLGDTFIVNFKGEKITKEDLEKINTISELYDYIAL